MTVVMVVMAVIAWLWLCKLGRTGGGGDDELVEGRSTRQIHALEIGKVRCDCACGARRRNVN